MYLTVRVDYLDRTEYVDWHSIQKEDNINNQVDTFSFRTKCYGFKFWRPNAGSFIEVTAQIDGVDGIEKVFTGVIVSVQESMDGEILYYDVSCKDLTHYFDQKVVTERFQDQTVSQIISFINSNYLSGFTINNVDCDIVLKTISFNRLHASECLQLLADRVNFYWYIDYDKDIHFFAKNYENAPFNLTDSNGFYIPSSLVIKDDISQIKNVVYVSGAEFKGSAKSLTLYGDGTTAIFYLGYKFSNEPTVFVGTTEQDVGAEFINKDEDHDCLWSYGQKYIRFVTPPANGVTIEITGTPLIPITIREEDAKSVAMYGEHEFSITNKNLRSKEECRQFALSQLSAYGSQISEGNFDTYNNGLRSGQVVLIDSEKRNIYDRFLIQRVTFQMRTPMEGIWSVELATMKTVGIITFLQSVLAKDDDQTETADNAALEKGYYDNQQIEITEEISKLAPSQDYQTVGVGEDIAKDPMGADTAPIFVLGPYFPSSHSDPYREGKLDISLILY